MKSEAPPQVESRRARMAVNVAVLLFGSAGLFAKWIQLPALQLAMWRVSISFFCLLMYNSLKKQVRSVVNNHLKCSSVIIRNVPV